MTSNVAGRAVGERLLHLADAAAPSNEIVSFHAFDRVFRAYEAEFLSQIRRLGEGVEPLFSAEIDHLEERLAAFLDVRNAIAVASGTAAVGLALEALDLQPCSTVLCPTYTFVGTANAVLSAGHRPFFVDCGCVDANVTPETILEAYDRASALGLAPSALITVDIFGVPVDYAAVAEVVSQLGLRWICDNAQSFGATLDGRSVMRFGDAATTSFYPAKVLGGVTDGGCVFTSSDIIAARVRLLRHQGWSADMREHVAGGTNARLSTIAAQFLTLRLGAVGDEMRRRLATAAIYDRELKECGGHPPQRHHGWNGYLYWLASSEIDRSLAHFRGLSIEVRRYYARTLHQIVGLPQGDDARRFVNAERLCGRLLCLPLHPFLSDAEVDQVTKALAAAPGLRG